MHKQDLALNNQQGLIYHKTNLKQIIYRLREINYTSNDFIY